MTMSRLDMPTYVGVDRYQELQVAYCLSCLSSRQCYTFAGLKRIVALSPPTDMMVTPAQLKPGGLNAVFGVGQQKNIRGSISNYEIVHGIGTPHLRYWLCTFDGLLPPAWSVACFTPPFSEYQYHAWF